MKKNKVKRIVALIVMCMMLCGISIVTYADVPPEHVCAFSFMGIDYVGRSHIAYHTFVDGNGITHTCEVVVDSYRDVYKCACGAVEYRNQHGIAIHLGHCGQ